MRFPLQVLLFRHADDLDFLPYEEAIVGAFRGGKEAGEYGASGENLGIELKVFTSAPALSVTELLEGFCHSMVIVLADSALLEKGGDPFWDWMEECWRQVDSSRGKHAMLVMPFDERTGGKFIQKRPSLGTLQLPQLSALGERVIRPAMLALRILHECRVLLSPPPVAGGTPAGFMRLFISHAKHDGLPLAQALKHQIQSVRWLNTFYDAEDLAAGQNWEKGLEEGVASSLIVMLRTNIYDSRTWCQKEVWWADEYATPAVLVDARTALHFPAGVLPFDRLPTVRIPDGNLVRIIFLALREGLRYLFFRRLVEEMKSSGQLSGPIELRVFSYTPSMAALLRACQSLVEAGTAPGIKQFIFYPDPPMRRGAFEAATALVQKYAPGANLVTPNTFAVLNGGSS